MAKVDFIVLLNQENEAFARAVSLNLQAGRKYFIFKGQRYSAQEIYPHLVIWAQNLFPEQFGDINPNIFSPDFLEQLIFSLTQKLNEAQGSNLPTPDQLREWQEALAEHEEWLASINQVDNQTTLEKLRKLDLKTQLDLIKRARELTKATIASQLNETFLQEELTKEREEVLEKTSQHLVRDIASRTDDFQEKPQEFVWQSIDRLCDQDPLVAMALASKKRPILAQELTTQLTSPENQPLVQQLPEAQKNLGKAKVQLSPSREKLTSLVQEKLGFSEAAAEKFVAGLERTLTPNPLPTPPEVKGLIKKNLPILEISRKGLSVEEIAEELIPLLTNYASAIPLCQPEAGRNFPVSKRTAQFSKVLGKRGFKQATPIVVENLLRGVTTQKIDQEISRLRSEGFNTSFLEQLKEKVQFFENNLSSLPFNIRQKINLARTRLKSLELIEKINPLNLGFYRSHFPKATQYLEAQFKLITNQFNLLRKGGSLGYRFSAWRWQQWGNLVNKISPNLKTRKFLYQLPVVSSWLRPAYWLRQGTAKLLISVGTKLAKKAFGVLLKETGKIIAQEGFKQGAAFLIGSLLSVSTGGVATVITVVTAVVSTAARLIFSKEGREFLKKVGSAAIQLGTGLVIFLAGLVSQFPLTFLLGIPGLIFGLVTGTPALFFLGGIGFLFDKGIAALGGLGGASQAIASTASLASPAAMAGAASISPGLTTATVASIGLPLATITTGVILINMSNSSAFVLHAPPEGYEEPEEAKYFIVSKKAEPQIEVGADTQVNYKIILTSKTEKLTNIQVKDKIDLNNLELIKVDNSGSFDSASGLLSWSPQDINSLGSTLTLNYQVKTKSSVNPKTKITNSVVATAFLTDGTKIERKSSLTLNSPGSEIAQRAREIVQNLQVRFWNYFNYSPDYPELFNNAEYQCCPNHCYLTSDYPSGCTGDPAAISTGEAMFWCTWLVVKTYNETGHPLPPYLGVQLMKEEGFEAQGKFLPPSTAVSQLELGDVVFFKKESRWAHVGIVCDLSHKEDYVTVCESNNSETLRNYTVSGDRLQGREALTIAGFGKP